MVLIIGYLLAGINHFVHPAGYIPIIPAYIPFPKLMNLLAGGFELLFALMLLSPKTRPIAAWGIILMLAAFMPVHIQMIIDAPFKLGNLMVTPLIAWIRVLLQPVLMLWAWLYAKK
jgi:uncharacterized membrane protein